MAEVKYVGVTLGNERIQQGDYVYCEADPGAHDFWGIYSDALATVISLNGAGDRNVYGKNIYVGQKINHWTIKKRIPCDKAIVEIDNKLW